MPKLYGNVDKIYVKSKGYQPITMTGEGYGDLLKQGAKFMGKKIIPLAKDVWDSLSPETKSQLVRSGVDFVGTNIERLGDVAQNKLKRLLHKEKIDGRISKKAQGLLKKLVKTTKKKATKKIQQQLAPAKPKRKTSKRSMETTNRDKLRAMLAEA